MSFIPNRATFLKLSMLTIALTTLGCEPAAKPEADQAASASDHGHDHPETLADAVKELQSTCATIKAAYEKDDAEAAHEPMHEVGHLLEQFPDLIAKSDLDEAGKEEAKKAAESLFESYNAVDAGMHGQEGKKYADVSEAIDASLQVLLEKTKG